uniref:Ig-like domain-containing protein n=2 Tax=Tetranychus urticae TaxID=32264 RepID=T1JQ40_TETUR
MNRKRSIDDIGNEEIAPTFVKKPRIRQEDDGNRLVFECQLISFPRPKITWYKEDVQIKDDQRIESRITEVGPNKFLVALELNDVIGDDSGIYWVKARNKQGEVSASIKLNFTPVDAPHDE